MLMTILCYAFSFQFYFMPVHSALRNPDLNGSQGYKIGFITLTAALLVYAAMFIIVETYVFFEEAPSDTLIIIDVIFQPCTVCEFIALIMV